jgi:transposase
MSLPIGLDIAKLKIDFYSNSSHCVIVNDEKSIKKHFKKLDRTSPIVMEATGKYHRTAHRTLEEMGFDVMVVNPYQSKHFAKAMNLRCKTDKVDAKMLSMFCERMEFKKTKCMSQHQEELQNLSRHLDDLKQLRVDTLGRKRDGEGFIEKSHMRILKTIEAEIKVTEAHLEKRLKSDEMSKRNLELLLSIPGVGVTTAVALLCLLKEIGHVSKRSIASLSGLAPMNFDSGTSKGKRRIQGGRHDVRRHLYMPVVGAATQSNPRLKKFYRHLVESGKPAKVALTACMRKLVVWANAILATGVAWEGNC